jgi:hypothetical protein
MGLVDECTRRLSQGEYVWFLKADVRKSRMRRSRFDEFPGVFTVFVASETLNGALVWHGFKHGNNEEVACDDFYEPPYEETFRPLFAPFSLVSVTEAAVCEKVVGRLLSPEEVPDRIARRVPGNLAIQRPSPDCVVTYGDGGRSVLCFPVYACPDLLDGNERLAFLAALNKRPIDMQSEIVRDILDPNWMPYRVEVAKELSFAEQVEAWKAKHPNTVFRPIDEDDLEELKWSEDAIKDRWYDCDGKTRSLHRKQLELAFPKVFNVPPLPPRVLLRQSYLWVPSRIAIDGSDEVRFLEHINRCPRTKETEDLYVGFEKVISRMLSMFRLLNVLPAKGTSAELQVICKAQSYTLQPGMTYKGHWHREGLDENIVAVGVYYVDIGNLVGGAVKFRSAGQLPSPDYADYCESKPEISVATKQNGCVAFANAIPHRVRMIQNRTARVQTRTFVNVFVVDPKRPLRARPCLITAVELAAIMREFVQSIGRQLPRDVIHLILGYCKDWMWIDNEHAQQFRLEARKAMQATKTSNGGFVHMNFGNCGVQSFLHPREMSSFEFRECELTHSSSNAASE